MKISATLATLAAAVYAAPAELSSTAAAACTTGDPVVTAGYTIKYAAAVPTAVQAGVGYQPDAAWAKQHVAATYVSLFFPYSHSFFFSSSPSFPDLLCTRTKD